MCAVYNPAVPDLAARIRQCSRLTGRFTLRSGKTSDTYFDKYQFEADPSLLRAIAQQLAGLVPEDTEVVAGLEMGGIPIVTLLSQVTGLPAAFIRKQPKRPSIPAEVQAKLAGDVQSKTESETE